VISKYPLLHITATKASSPPLALNTPQEDALPEAPMLLLMADGIRADFVLDPETALANPVVRVVLPPPVLAIEAFEKCVLALDDSMS